MEKIKLSQLTEKDAENLMDNNKVWTKTTGEIAEEASLMLDDFLDALKGLGRYSISDNNDLRTVSMVSDLVSSYFINHMITLSTYMFSTYN